VRAILSAGEPRLITDGTGWVPAQMAKLQVRRLGMDWRESDIRDMLRSGAMTGLARISYRRGAPRLLDGYILFRTMADEGEILSFAVRPQSRRRGCAKDLLARMLSFMRNKRVKRVFLEVSSANRAAIAFYTNAGFKIIGVRRGYYASKNGDKYNALVLGMVVPGPRIRRRQGKVMVRYRLRNVI
jgi:[ribosomal protein S18]-alanine N-acetyltransferase